MKAMVLFSGGIDSTTCLGMAIEKYGAQNVIALSISYGQKHTKEIEASDKIVKYYNVKHIYLDLEKIFQYSDCSLLSHSDKEIPKEAYSEQIKKYKWKSGINICSISKWLILIKCGKYCTFSWMQ